MGGMASEAERDRDNIFDFGFGLYSQGGDGKSRDQLSKRRDIPYDVLSRHFGMTVTAAAAALGVGRTTLKLICRSHGIQRWPKRSPDAHANAANGRHGAAAARAGAVAVPRLRAPLFVPLLAATVPCALGAAAADEGGEHERELLFAFRFPHFGIAPAGVAEDEVDDWEAAMLATVLPRAPVAAPALAAERQHLGWDALALRCTTVAAAPEAAARRPDTASGWPPRGG